LSAIKLLARRNPFRSFCSTRMRNKGASVGSLVKAQMVMDGVLSKSLSWTITTGLGLPM
jgi:hypothetical protein